MGTRSHAINLIEMVRLADDAIVVVSAGGVSISGRGRPHAILLNRLAVEIVVN
jgi:hypothetical protein